MKIAALANLRRQLAAFEFPDHHGVVERQNIPYGAREDRALRDHVARTLPKVHPGEVAAGFLGHGAFNNDLEITFLKAALCFADRHVDDF